MGDTVCTVSAEWYCGMGGAANGPALGPGHCGCTVAVLIAVYDSYYTTAAGIREGNTV